jgi:hypothetical protein
MKLGSVRESCLRSKLQYRGHGGQRCESECSIALRPPSRTRKLSSAAPIRHSVNTTLMQVNVIHRGVFCSIFELLPRRLEKPTRVHHKRLARTYRSQGRSSSMSTLNYARVAGKQRVLRSQMRTGMSAIHWAAAGHALAPRPRVRCCLKTCEARS